MSSSAPEDRATLASLIRRERDKIPDEISRLQDEQQRLNQWLAEFAPELADEHCTPQSRRHCGGKAPVGEERLQQRCERGHDPVTLLRLGWAAAFRR